MLDASPRDELRAIARAAPGELRVVFEVTERAIAARPAELLNTVARIRAEGWAIALDDVGADPTSLAFMSLLQPEVVKLDLRLIQERPTPEIAAIMHAVNAYTEASGALLLAEGIETQAHLAAARALGARFGQGWLLGRPGERASGLPIAAAQLPAAQRELVRRALAVRLHPPGTPLRQAGKRLLIELSKKLEEEALARGETAILTATFQEARHFTPAHGGALRPPRRRHRLRVRSRRGPARGADPRASAARTSTRATRCAANGTSSCSRRTSQPRCSPATSATAGPTSSAGSSTR